MEKSQVQKIVLDTLLKALENGIRGYVNIIQELPEKISLNELRSAIIFFSELGYIEHDDTIPIKKGLYCKITKDGIKYFHEEYKEMRKSKTFGETIKEFLSYFEGVKTIVITIVTICTIIFGINFEKIFQQSKLHSQQEITDESKNNNLDLQKANLIEEEKNLFVTNNNKTTDILIKESIKSNVNELLNEPINLKINKEENGIFFHWNKSNKPNLIFYKLMFSKNNPNPEYPKDEMVYYSDDNNVTEVFISKNDIGWKKEGYWSICYIFEGFYENNNQELRNCSKGLFLKNN